MLVAADDEVDFRKALGQRAVLGEREMRERDRHVHLLLPQHRKIGRRRLDGIDQPNPLQRVAADALRS